MSNPWAKKNPFMSMWLSGFNAAANTVRGTAMAQAKRNVASATKTFTTDFFNFLAGPSPAIPKRRRKKR